MSQIIKKGNIEVRLKDGKLDEIVVVNKEGDCVFHLEQMTDNHWWLAAYDQDHEVHVDLTSDSKIEPNIQE
jgi:hypothetical protein